MLKKFTISTRLSIGFSVMILITMILGGLSIFQIRYVLRSTDAVLSVDIPMADNSYTVRAGLLNIRRHEKDALLNINNIPERTAANSKWGDEIMFLEGRVGDIIRILESSSREEDLRIMKGVRDDLEKYSKGFKSVYESISDGKIKKIEDANAALAPHVAHLVTTERYIQSFNDSNIVSIRDRSKALVELGGLFSIFLIGALGAAVCAGIIISILISRSIKKPINNVTDRLPDIAEGGGDLTVAIKHDAADETGKFADGSNRFVERIRAMVKDVAGASEKLSASSNEMAVSASSLSDNVQGQASSAEEISATLEEMNAGVDSISDNAALQFEKLTGLIAQISQLSGSIREMERSINDTMILSETISNEAKSGGELVRMMTSSMDKITESSNKMSGIINIINDISDQINLLSLNAAIEAARAGEAGRGFAVVADEVSKLAEQTSSSLKEIDSLVRINTSETLAGLTSVTNTNNTIVKIIEGVNSITSKMEELFSRMKRQIEVSSSVDSEILRLKSVSDEIRMAIGEEKTAFSEIVKSIASINELSQSNAAVSQELATTSKMIMDLSENLNSQVNRFKV